MRDDACQHGALLRVLHRDRGDQADSLCGLKLIGVFAVKRGVMLHFGEHVGHAFELQAAHPVRPPVRRNW